MKLQQESIIETCKPIDKYYYHKYINTEDRLYNKNITKYSYRSYVSTFWKIKKNE